MLIFCATCYDASHHNITVAVNESNSNGNCSRCGSHAVMPADILQRHVEDNKVVERAEPKPKRVYPRDHWRKQNADAIMWLAKISQKAADLWDGWSVEPYFEDGQASLEFANCDGTKFIVSVVSMDNITTQDSCNQQLSEATTNVVPSASTLSEAKSLDNH